MCFVFIIIFDLNFWSQIWFQNRRAKWRKSTKLGNFGGLESLKETEFVPAPNTDFSTKQFFKPVRAISMTMTSSDQFPILIDDSRSRTQRTPWICVKSVSMDGMWGRSRCLKCLKSMRSGALTRIRVELQASVPMITSTDLNLNIRRPIMAGIASLTTRRRRQRSLRLHWHPI